jgi:uncharacterized protein YndB with AHSA1/START domain
MPLTHIDEAVDVTLTWHMQASTARLWQCLTDAHLLNQWLGRLVAGAVRTGSDFVVDHGDGYLCSSRVIECVEGEGLDFTWQFPDEPPSRVALGVDESDGTSVLRLKHSELGDLADSYRVGWSVHLAYLEAASLGTPLPPSMFWPIHGTMALLSRL